MTVNHLVPGLVPRKQAIANPALSHIWFRLHGQEPGKAADILHDYGNTGLFEDNELDIGGTPTNYWDTAGLWTPAGDHGNPSSDANLKAFFDAETLRAAETNLAFIATVKINTDPSSEESFLDVGRNAPASNGGYGIKLIANGSLALDYREQNGGSIVAKANNDLSSHHGTEIVIGLYLDWAAETPRVYTIRNADTSTVQSADLETPVPSIPEGQVVNFFARGGGTGNALDSGGSGIQIADSIFAQLDPATGYADWVSAMQEIKRHPRATRLAAFA